MLNLNDEKKQSCKYQEKNSMSFSFALWWISFYCIKSLDRIQEQLPEFAGKQLNRGRN